MLDGDTEETLAARILARGAPALPAGGPVVRRGAALAGGAPRSALDRGAPHPRRDALRSPCASSRPGDCLAVAQTFKPPATQRVYDVCVIGSQLGGVAAGALLSRRGFRVLPRGRRRPRRRVRGRRLAPPVRPGGPALAARPSPPPRRCSPSWGSRPTLSRALEPLPSGPAAPAAAPPAGPAPGPRRPCRRAAARVAGADAERLDAGLARLPGRVRRRHAPSSRPRRRYRRAASSTAGRSRRRSASPPRCRARPARAWARQIRSRGSGTTRSRRRSGRAPVPRPPRGRAIAASPSPGWLGRALRGSHRLRRRAGGARGGPAAQDRRDARRAARRRGRARHRRVAGGRAGPAHHGPPGRLVRHLRGPGLRRRPPTRRPLRRIIPGGGERLAALLDTVRPARQMLALNLVVTPGGPSARARRDGPRPRRSRRVRGRRAPPRDPRRRAASGKKGASEPAEAERVLAVGGFVAARSRDHGRAHLGDLARGLRARLVEVLPYLDRHVVHESVPELAVPAEGRGSRLLPHPLYEVHRSQTMGVTGLPCRTPVKNLCSPGGRSCPGSGWRGSSTPPGRRPGRSSASSGRRTRSSSLHSRSFRS